MAWGAAAFYSGQFPISEFIQLPLNGINSAQMGSKVFMDMLAEIPEVAAEWDGVKVIQLQGNCPGILSTTKQYGKVESADQLKGLQFRTAGTTAGLWVSAVGMEPVTVPTSDTYEYLEKNIVNGCMNDWHNIDCFKLYEVIGYAMDYCVATSPCFVIMNQANYDAFPQHVKDAIDLYSGTYASDMAGWYWDTCYFTTRAEMEANGVEVYEPSDELLAYMTSDEIKDSVHSQYIDYLNSYGLDGQAIYDQCMDIVARYADEYADVYDTEIAIDGWTSSDIAQADLAANAAALGITLG
jgi:TRAP-type C4-dicarboxylate transport system substrate-binding protein